ncbi:NUDIX hydrolase [Thiopseudomonas acetoxidans]|uniref:Phosphatase NudJ n=1 Tax=Thiopseudomonas acetoxidans TaxID=3041622 RepID=A0ABT7SP40_9GAMM|nr:NUDIX hydrolase [Thiopseudomonas sp. CY1220]MDM7857327.1 NUDIX hydrolase [Thiopseudomonas sp. CY1220]
MSFAPHITVATIVEQHGRFLFVKEFAKNTKVLNQPAGHLEMDESLNQAAIRETLEETAWLVELTALVGIYLYQAPNGVTYQRICFAAKPIMHQPERALDAGIIEALWLSHAQLLERQEQCRSPLVLQSLNDYLAGSVYPLSVMKGVF